MGMPFARTLRALERDRSHIAPVAIISVLLLGIAWSFWFFGAQIPIYQSTTTVEINRRNEIVAYLPAGASLPRRGQSAIVQLTTGAIDLPAIVVEALPEPDGRVKAVLALQTMAPVALTTVEIGQIAIETARVSPATIVLGEVRESAIAGNK